ncbi:hypothetical protein SADUNF_Sadunf05G0020400 [Salix dunnii]|uniref:HMA domain-containing protein n=1 Tax=Salix dunnii TaxID=1413687 RepID=A0A835K923_9ROSI|nr:hypothetical protein SADUNF_Sadunf05G0020400 [Salix dunnii]
MNKQEVLKMQTHTLKVNIDCHCDGCKKKIKKMLRKIEGVYSTTIDAEHGKVTVTGNVDPAKLIKQFEKSGKHAELWGGNQFKNMQIDGGKGGGGKDSKSQKAGKGQQVQMTQQPMKGSKDVKMPPNKEKKSVKFNLNEDDFDASDDDDDFDDDEIDDEEDFGRGHGQSRNTPNKMMPVMSNGHGPHGMVGGPGFNDKMGGGGGGGKAKKGGGDGFEIPAAMKGKGDSKDVKGGKKGGGGGDGKNAKSKEENKKGGGKDKKDGKSGIGFGFLGFGKKSKKGEDSTPAPKAAANNGSAGGNGNNNGGGAKKAGGKTDTTKMKPGFPENDGTGNGHKNPGQTGPMGQTGKAPSAAAMNGGGGYYQEMGQGNPYSQQQYMAMMMNQQRQYGNDMFQPMMYAPPHPAINYMQPPIPHPTASDQYTHVFNDENTDSCSIM